MAPPREDSALATFAERAELEALGEEIATLAAQIHAATYRLLVMIAEFDERQGWNSGGPGAFHSCAHWLSWRTGISMGPAREKVRTARALSELPKISAAMERGELSFSKVRALTRVATPEKEQELLEFAQAGTTAHVEKLVRLWRRMDRQEEIDEAQAQHEGRKLAVYFDDDGTLVIRGRLAPEAGAAVLRAIEAAEDELWRAERPQVPHEGEGQHRGEGQHPHLDPPPAGGGGREANTSTPALDPHVQDADPSPAQRRADALVHLAEQALGNTPGDRYQVVVHVAEPVLEDADARGVSALEDGVRVSAETSQRIACDCSKVEVTVDDEGSALDIGRKSRVVPAPMRRALEMRDLHCRFPGCTSRHCDAHHLVHWAAGGETKLDNLVLLCRRHHRLVHEGGFRAELGQGGALEIRWPGGAPLPWAPVVRAEEELETDPAIDGSSLPVWNGQPCEWRWVTVWR